MVRRVFFSFHYERDVWRVNQVRNSNVIQGPDIEEDGYIDSASWEQLKKQGDDAIEEWIDEQLTNTSVTVVLIGTETHDRDWVHYEIEQSIADGKGLLGIRIHNIRDDDSSTDARGPDPLDDHSVPFTDGTSRTASNYYNTYDWVLDDGGDNIGSWIEEAAQLAGR